MGRPRGRPPKVKPPKVEESDEDNDDTVEQEDPNELPPTKEHEITPEQQQTRGAFDTESMRRNQVHSEIVRARRAGKKVKFNGPPEDRYNQCTESYPDRCMVSIERIYPSIIKLRTIQAATVPTFDDLDRYVREHFWNGQDQGYKFTIKLAGAFQTTGNWSLGQDPSAMEHWSSKLAQAQRVNDEDAYNAANGNQNYQQRFVRGNQQQQVEQPAVVISTDEEPYEEDMNKGYWVTNGQPGSQPVYVSENQPPPPGYYPMQPAAPPVAAAAYAPPPPPVPQAPPVGAIWNGQSWTQPAPVAPPTSLPTPTVDDALARELRELRAERDRDMKQTFEDIKGMFANLAKSAAKQQQVQAQQPQVQQQSSGMTPEFMRQVPPGAVWDGTKFVFEVGRQQPQQQAAQQQVHAPDPVDTMDAAVSLVQRTKRLASVLADSYGPKAEAAVEAASSGTGIQMETPMRSLTFEDVGGGTHLAFKKDGEIALGPSVLPLLPKILDLVNAGLDKWTSVESKRADLAIEAAKRDRSALDRAMQLNGHLERQLSQNQPRSENQHAIQVPTTPAIQTEYTPPSQPDVSVAQSSQSEPIMAEVMQAQGGMEPWDSVPSEQDEDPMFGALHVARSRLRSPQPTPEG